MNEETMIQRLKDLFVVTQLVGDGAGSPALEVMLFYYDFCIGVTPIRQSFHPSLFSLSLPLSLFSVVCVMNINCTPSVCTVLLWG